MIYIVLHKPYSIPKKDFYSSIRVRSGWISDGSLLTDKSGESIHSKNANYSELTAAYWIWKNKTDDIKGIIHYRRYFIKSRYLVKQLLPWMMLTEKDVHRILSYNDIIVPKAIPKKESLFVEYEKGHYINDLNQCKEVILELFPSYIDSFDYVINSHQKEFTFYYNMMIAPKSIYDNYCEWLFTVLFEVERRIDISDYDDYQKRVFAFLSERLFNVWLYHNNIRYKEVNVINIEITMIVVIKSVLYRLMNKVGLGERLVSFYRYFKNK